MPFFSGHLRASAGSLQTQTYYAERTIQMESKDNILKLGLPKGSLQ
jgi:hypothetical protein